MEKITKNLNKLLFKIKKETILEAILKERLKDRFDHIRRV